MGDQGARGGGEAGGGASHVVAAGILASRSLGLVREVLVAALAGPGLAADVLQVALRGPNLLQNLLGEQALSASFIPIYSRFLEEGREREARRFAGSVFGLLGLVAGALALILALIAPVWVTIFVPGFRARPEAFALAVAAMRLLFPMTAVLVLSAWCLAVLNSHRRFFLPYFAPVLWNLSLVVALGALAVRVVGPPPARALVLTVAAAALVGAVLQLLVQLPLALRLNGGALDLRPRLDAPGVRAGLTTFGPALLGRGSVQLSGFLDVFLASFLMEGAMAALGFAQRLYLLPVALFGTAVAVVELPELSRLGPGAEEGGSAARRVERALRDMGFLTVPSAVGFLTLGWLVVAAIYQRGAFGGEGTWLVYGVLASYALGMVASTTSRVLQSSFYAHRDTRTPARLALLRVGVQGAIGGLAMWWLDRFAVAQLAGEATGAGLRWGAVGLAAGSSVAAWVELLALRRALARAAAARAHAAPAVPWRRLVVFASIALGASLVAGALWLAARRWPPVAAAALALPAFVAAYLGLAGGIGLEESRRFWSRLRSLRS
ncbi:MAG TPA: murein biosynthesis integral membrane protein MurJ [Thermoanaerobaculia bacterium]|nr:murein biosynthesis integral membrane protein MurJ [Thermoanaerobaculia bacterium]